MKKHLGKSRVLFLLKHPGKEGEKWVMNEQLFSIWTTVFASQGLWALILYLVQRKNSKKDKKEEVLNHQSQMLLGLGHDRIISLGKEYLAQGSITEDDFENLNKYLYEPYKALGGNGTAEKIMNDVKKLPIHLG